MKLSFLIATVFLSLQVLAQEATHIMSVNPDYDPITCANEFIQLHSPDGTITAGTARSRLVFLNLPQLSECDLAQMELPPCVKRVEAIIQRGKAP